MPRITPSKFDGAILKSRTNITVCSYNSKVPRRCDQHLHAADLFASYFLPVVIHSRDAKGCVAPCGAIISQAESVWNGERGSSPRSVSEEACASVMPRSFESSNVSCGRKS